MRLSLYVLLVFVSIILDIMRVYYGLPEIEIFSKIANTMVLGTVTLNYAVILLGILAQQRANRRVK